MAFFILPFVLLFFVIGVQSAYGPANRNISQPGFGAANSMESVDFLTYHAAVENYAEANPSFTGSIPVSQLGLPIGFTMPPYASNQIASSSSGRAVLSWYTPSSGQFVAPQSAFQDNAAFGYVSGNLFHDYMTNQSESLPVAIPNGDIAAYDVQQGD